MCENYRKQRGSLAARKASLRQAQDKLDGTLEARERKRTKTVSPEQLELWHSSQKIDSLADDTERQFTAAVRLLEQSLQEQDNRPAHTLLASLYWDKYAEAKRLEMIKRHCISGLSSKSDTGMYADALSDMGRLEIVHPRRAEISVEDSKTDLLTREPVSEDLNKLPIGSYLATISAPGVCLGASQLWFPVIKSVDKPSI